MKEKILFILLCATTLSFGQSSRIGFGGTIGTVEYFVPAFHIKPIHEKPMKASYTFFGQYIYTFKDSLPFHLQTNIVYANQAYESKNAKKMDGSDFGKILFREAFLQSSILFRINYKFIYLAAGPNFTYPLFLKLSHLHDGIKEKIVFEEIILPKMNNIFIPKGLKINLGVQFPLGNHWQFFTELSFKTRKVFKLFPIHISQSFKSFHLGIGLNYRF